MATLDKLRAQAARPSYAGIKYGPGHVMVAGLRQYNAALRAGWVPVAIVGTGTVFRVTD